MHAYNLHIYMSRFPPHDFPPTHRFPWNLQQQTQTSTATNCTKNMLPNTGTASHISRLGVQQAAVKRERQAVTPRDGLVWKCVSITREHATSPALKCNFSQHEFCGSASRIRNHICEKCTGTSDEFCDMKEKLLQERMKSEAKKQKQAVHARGGGGV